MSRKLAYKGSDELRACFRVRGGAVCCATDEDAGGVFVAGEIRLESSSTKATFRKE